MINDWDVFSSNQVLFFRYTAFNRMRINILKSYAWIIFFAITAAVQ